MLHIGNHGRDLQVILLYCMIWTESKQRSRWSIISNSTDTVYSRDAFRCNVLGSDIPGPCFSGRLLVTMINPSIYYRHTHSCTAVFFHSSTKPSIVVLMLQCLIVSRLEWFVVVPFPVVSRHSRLSSHRSMLAKPAYPIFALMTMHAMPS